MISNVSPEVIHFCGPNQLMETGAEQTFAGHGQQALHLEVKSLRNRNNLTANQVFEFLNRIIKIFAVFARRHVGDSNVVGQPKQGCNIYRN